MKITQLKSVYFLLKLLISTKGASETALPTELLRSKKLNFQIFFRQPIHAVYSKNHLKLTRWQSLHRITVW